MRERTIYKAACPERRRDTQLPRQYGGEARYRERRAIDGGEDFGGFIGRKYERTKKAQNDGGAGIPKGSEDQNDPRLTTAEKIAAQHGISAPTVKRAAEFSRNVDSIADQIGESARAAARRVRRRARTPLTSKL